MAETVRPPSAARVRRNRPTLATTLHPDIIAEARRRAVAARVPVGRVIELGLRLAFGLPEVPLGPATNP